MLIRIFSPTECGLIRDADLKKCGLNRMTTVGTGSELELIFSCGTNNYSSQEPDQWNQN
jgi:hypothetical protein